MDNIFGFFLALAGFVGAAGLWYALQIGEVLKLFTRTGRVRRQ